MDSLDPLRRADQALKKMAEEKQRAKLEAERNAILQGVSENLPQMMEPLLHQVSENARFNTQEVVDAIRELQIGAPEVNVQVETPKAEVTVTQEKIEMPEIKTDGIVSAIKEAFKGITFPKPEVTVNTPKQEFPKYPDFPAFPESFSLKGVSPKQPLPVQMVDMAGKPFFPQAGGGIGGGRSDFFTIKDIQTSAGASLIDQVEGALKVTGNFSITSSATSTYAQLVDSDGNGYSSTNPLQIAGSISTTPGATFYASDAVGSVNVIQSVPIDVRQVSGVAFSVSVNDVFGSTGTNVINPDGRLKVELPTGSSGLTDTELRASHLDVQQLSGAIDSVNVVSTVGLTDTQLRASSFGVSQVSGASFSVDVLSIPSVTVTSVTNSVQSAIIDSSGVQYSGSNPFPVSNIGLAVDNGDAASAQRVVIAGNSSASVSASQVGTWNVSVSDIFGSVGTNVVNPDGRLKVELPTGSSGLTDTELRASHLDVQQVSGATDSVFITGASGTIGVVTINPDGSPIYAGSSSGGTQYTDGSTASTPTGTVAMGETGEESGNVWALATFSGVVSSGTLRTVQAVDSVSSVNIVSSVSLAVSGITNSVAASLVDSSGVQYSGSNPVPVVFGASATQAVNLVDSSGVAYSGSNAVPTTGIVTGLNETNANVFRVVQMTDSIASINNVQWGGSAVATGLNENTAGVVKVFQVTSAINSVNVVTFNGNAPATGTNETNTGVLRTVQMTDSISSVFVTGAAGSIIVYEARTTNPTAKSDGADVRPKTDKLGRTLSRPIQVRDLIKTAYASTATQAEVTLATPAASTFWDLIYIMAANNSATAAQIDVRQGTGGTVIMSVNVPGNGTAGISLPVPMPGTEVAQPWTIKNSASSDVSNWTVNVSALFSQEL